MYITVKPLQILLRRSKYYDSLTVSWNLENTHTFKRILFYYNLLRKFPLVNGDLNNVYPLKPSGSED